MPTDQILRSCLITTLEEEETDVNHWRDGKVNLTNPDTGTGQKTYLAADDNFI
jgi:hypothetical protein